MNFTIREIDVRADRRRLLPFLLANLPGHGGEAHYDWLYLGNPAGPARAWVAETGSPERILGAAAAFPKRVRLQGHVVTCWNLGDFAVSPEARSLGPALKLQRACLAPVLSGEIPFAYDHPSRAMLSVYARLGVRPTGSIVRHARLLRSESQLKQRLRIGPLADGLGLMINVGLSMWKPLPSVDGIVVRDLQGPFDEPLSRIRCEARDRAPIVLDRTPEYLEWRYRACPMHRYERFVAHRDGAPVGFIVVRQDGRDNGIVVDLAGGPEGSAALLRHVLELLRTRGVGTLSVPLLEGGPEPFPARDWGFVPRESSPFVVTVAPDSEFAGVVDRAANWFLGNGDRDV